MISVTSAQLSAWIALFIFPFTRILALIASSPVLGNRQIPARLKIALALLITFIIVPTLEPLPAVEPASAMGLLMLMQQILAGLLMGFTMRLIFTAVEMCGELIGMQMGLGFASFFDQMNATFTPVVAQFLGIIAALAFIAMDGHLYMLQALAESFQTFPIGVDRLNPLALRSIAEWGGSMFTHAVQLSMPVIGALLFTNIALAVLTSSAPQLNIFAIGFPLTLAIGFAALILSIPYFAPLLDRFTYVTLEAASRIVQQLGMP